MKKVRLGVIGLGQRGKYLLENLILKEENVLVTAISDVYLDRVSYIKDLMKKDYNLDVLGTTNYHEVLNNDLVDAVLISTSWETHIEIAIKAMKKGIVVGLEVGGAYSINDCWDLVKTYEETQTPFMFLENCCFHKEELLAASLSYHNVLGEIVHVSGSYTHDIREEIVTGIENRHYRLENYIKRNGDNYPTHDLGPLAKILGINRGNQMVSLVSMSSKAKGLNHYINKKEGYVNPQVKDITFNQGDIVYTLIKCANCETITLKLDTTLPGFATRDLVVKGVNGMYQQNGNIVVIDGIDNKDDLWGGTESITKLMNNASRYHDEYLPDYWTNITEEEINRGHGGMDLYMFRTFINNIINKEEMPIDVYDAASWMVITILSEESIKLGSMSVDIPDFTKGKWLNRPFKPVVELKKKSKK